MGDLFQSGANGVKTLSPSGEKRANATATQFGNSLAARPIVVEGYSATQDHDQQFVLSCNRAIAISQYLRTHFHLDARSIGIVFLMVQPPSGVHKNKWDGICIVVLK